MLGYQIAVNVYIKTTAAIMKHFSCDIRQRLPKSTFLPHPTGIVIAGGCEFGEGIKIRQNVTIGTKKGAGYPKIKDNVEIGAGAKIIGSVTVGENSKIGANATVIDDVPPNSTAVGTPARIIQN